MKIPSMNLKGRQEILSNVKYLKNIRPVDVEEIKEYLSETIDLRSIRLEIVRNAFELGLVEREDGKFTPVSEEPISPKLVSIQGVPEKHIERLESVLKDRYGNEWESGGSGDDIRERIREIKKNYYESERVEYNEENSLAYAIYHLPGYYAAIQYILNKISKGGLLRRKLRILDVGAGIGGPALGIVDYLPKDALVEYNVVEPSDAAEILQTLMEGKTNNVHLNIYRDTAEEFDPSGVYDIILLANVISELNDPSSVVEKYSEFVSDTGSMILVEPADKNTAIGLRKVERSIAETMNIYAPTIRLWQNQVPCSESWSFEVMPDIEIPSFQQRIDQGGQRKGEFTNVDVQVSYSILRWDSNTLFEIPKDRSRCVKLSEVGTKIGKRIKIIAVKLSQNLSENENPLFLIGDGSEEIDSYAVVVKKTPQNKMILDADYGRIVLIKGALVLWNDDEGAYNLVIDKETIIE